MSFCGKDIVRVYVGPSTVKHLQDKKIALDGRKYENGGTIIFSNGQEFRASFCIDTTSFNFVNKDSIYLSIGDEWYHIEEPELITKLNIREEDIYPLKWAPDRPLDYHVKPPYLLQKEKLTS